MQMPTVPSGISKVWTGDGSIPSRAPRRPMPASSAATSRVAIGESAVQPPHHARTGCACHDRRTTRCISTATVMLRRFDITSVVVHLRRESRERSPNSLRIGGSEELRAAVAGVMAHRVVTQHTHAALVRIAMEVPLGAPGPPVASRGGR